MPNDILYTEGTQISFADFAGDFGPTAANDLRVGTDTETQLITTSVADDAARQSAKVDLTATRARAYSLMAAVEMAATPVTGEVIEFYWAASPNTTAATANAGYTTGSDAAYDGGVATLDEGLAQLEFIGSLVCSADATTTVQIARIGVLVPAERYGMLVVVNRSGIAFHSDDVETHFVLNPIIDEVQ